MLVLLPQYWLLAIINRLLVLLLLLLPVISVTTDSYGNSHKVSDKKAPELHWLRSFELSNFTDLKRQSILYM
jgi:hypothetical protein